MKTIATLTALTMFAAAPALAGHANLWATDDDVLLDQYHEENLAQSKGTPGEDEMLGVMVRNARGKLEDVRGGGSGGQSGQGGSGGGQGRGR